MSERKCPGCGHLARKFVTATLIRQDGDITDARVCQRCERDGMLIVAQKVPPIVQSTEKKDLKEVLSPFMKAIQTRITMTKLGLRHASENETPAPNLEVQLETLEGVLHMLKEGRA